MLYVRVCFLLQVFNVYIYFVATCFLIYIHISHVILPKRTQAKKQEERKALQRVLAAHNHAMCSVAESDGLDESASDDYIECPAITIHTAQAAHTKADSGIVLEDTAANDEDSTGTPSPIVATVSRRCHTDNHAMTNGRVSFQIESDRLTAFNYDYPARGRLDSRRDSQLSQVLTEEVEEYLNLQQGTASFSHEATNFYMRLGVLCKYMRRV